MNQVFKCFFLIIFFFSIAGFGQQTAVYTNDMADFHHAVMLYNNKNYQAAQTLFTKIKNNTDNPTIESDCSYYIANTAIRLNQQTADQMMEQFVEEYPTSTKRNSAFLEVGYYYFDTGKYAQALKWFEKASETNLGIAERDKFYFQKGYAHFQSKDSNNAKKYFERVSASQEYGSQAKYYLGYMAYEGDDYGTATVYFDQVQDEHYSENLLYYQADMNFKLGKFEEAIKLGKEQYGKANAQEKSQLSKIIGESYFNLKQYEAAIPYLKEYKGTRGRWNNTDFYQLGYAYYKQNDYKNAIAEFNKIVDGKNAVAQNAFYHLGESYLKENQKQQALNAFKNASEMDFSAEIQEDAFYNYAKLSYEIGNIYTSVPQVISDYLKKYPSSKYKTQMEELLIDSYVTSKNFKAAFDLLEKNKNANNRATYQKVAFYVGLESINDQLLNDAEHYLGLAIKENANTYYTARAVFWKAETDYHLNNFNKALSGFKQFSQISGYQQTPEAKNLDYHLGYTQFKLKNYSQAITVFKQFVESNNANNELAKDANLRLADSYFMSSQYWPAMESYNKVIAAGGTNSDYAAFQKAISYGFVDRTQTKLEELIAFDKKYPKSSYRGDALYELGNTYLALNQNDNAVSSYDKLINTLPQSNYVPKSLLKKGLILYNTDKSQQALTIFKRVANDFPSTPEAVQAVATAKLIYIDLGKVGEYAAWVKTLDFVEIADAELDQASFDAAENRYFQNDTEQAKILLAKYLSDFPNGIHTLPANFYLGQMYYSTDNLKAAVYYEAVAEKETTEYTEESLTKLSLIYLEKSDYQTAIPKLERLENIANRQENLIFAQSNLMKSYYEQKNFSKAAAYADKVLANAEIGSEVKNDAQVIIARTAMTSGNESKAKTAYAEVQKTAKGQLAAEALYYDAYFKNIENNYQKSNEAVQKLAKDYSGYKEWGGKGLILMAKNFYGLNDAFQATYILESVIQNFKDYPEITAEAQGELNIIKKKEAETNTSVEVDD